MQYLINVIAGPDQPGTDEEMAAIDLFNDGLQRDGHWVFAGGLAGPDASTVIDGRSPQPVISDGPFIESKEFLAGFWIIDAADLDEAIALAAAGSKACNRRVEVRPFQ